MGIFKHCGLQMKCVYLHLTRSTGQIVLCVLFENAADLPLKRNVDSPIPVEGSLCLLVLRLLTTSHGLHK